MNANPSIDALFEKNGIYLRFCANARCGKRGTLVDASIDSPVSEICHRGAGQNSLHITFKQSGKTFKKSFFNTSCSDQEILSYVCSDGLCICDKSQITTPRKTTVSNITLRHNRALISPLESDNPVLRDDGYSSEFNSNYVTFPDGYSATNPPPVQYKSTFGHVRNRSGAHYGWDFSYTNSTPVYALADGIVTVCKPDNTGTAGRTVRIQFTYSGDTTYYAHYCHLEDVLVSHNQCVRAGSLIGHMGKSGTSAQNLTHPHLHLSIMNASPSSIDPQELFGDWKEYVPQRRRAISREEEGDEQWGSTGRAARSSYMPYPIR